MRFRPTLLSGQMFQNGARMHAVSWRNKYLRSFIDILTVLSQMYPSQKAHKAATSKTEINAIAHAEPSKTN